MVKSIFKTDENLAKKYFEDILELSTIRKDSELIEKYRQEFSRDRDRILYSTAFRRLSGKTQVFIAGFDAHIRNRLTHTLEVNQIAKTLNNIFGLNETLSEAISLGHDIGHAPFGHVGEHIIICIMNNCFETSKFGIRLDAGERGFKHNFQSYRILNELELNRDGTPGLGLTYFTLYGIIYHTKIKNKVCENWFSKKYCSLKGNEINCNNKGITYLDFYDDYLTSEILNKSWSFEAFIVKWADEIAQRHHDIEDALIAGIIDTEEINEELKRIPNVENTYKKYFAAIEKQSTQDKNWKVICSNYSKILVDSYVSKYKAEVERKFENIKTKYDIDDNKEYWNKRESINLADVDLDFIINYEKHFKEDKRLHDFLKNKIIHSEDVQIMNSKGIYIISNLFQRYLANPLTLPDSAINAIFSNMNHFNPKDYDMKKLELISKMNIWQKRKTFEDDFIIADKLAVKKNNQDNKDDFFKIIKRVICDQISYMTDEFALKQFRKLFESEGFKNF